MSDSHAPWHRDGLRFACTHCGHCCRIQGHVWVDLGEIHALARHLDIEVEEFGRRYLRRVGNRFSLLDGLFQDCIFWKEGCSVYDARPRQCRTFPFWEENLESDTTWRHTARECEGVGKGRLYQLSEIDSLSRGCGETSEGQTPEDTPSSSK